MRQVDVARASGVSRNKVSAIENGRRDEVVLTEVERSFAALDARVEYIVHRHGASLDRLLDEGHAKLAGLVLAYLRTVAWLVEIEVTFSRLGERGSIDLLAWHAATRTLLVVEIKTELGSVEGLLRPLDIKVRQAARIAAERFGWHPLVVARLVVLPESSASRRAVGRHEAVFSTALPVRSRDVRQWLRSPKGALRGLWFLSAASNAGVKRNPSAIRRVRAAKRASAEGDAAA